ncbi:MAG: PD-(D/E)XK nuclease family protein, partial [bacterium]|nr:PD-(D/E)XK nuclease family protein [bacterium]
LTQLFLDPIGLWIISPREKEWNEYELLIEHQNNLVTRIIDRAYEENNQFWIVDFKTGREDSLNQLQYTQQLNDYAFYLSHRTHLPIYCGLYYLATGHWITWPYQPVENKIDSRIME